MVKRWRAGCTRGSIAATGALTSLLACAALSAISPAAAAAAPVCPPAASTPLVAAPSESSPAPALPAPEQLVACIGAQPLLGATLAHWTTVAQKSGARVGTAAATQQAMSFLLSGYWVLDEASDLGIRIGEAQVRRSFERIRAQQFHKRRQFEAFLRSSGQTVGDLLFRVRLNLTSLRIQRRILSGHGSAKSREKALARFVLGFKRKWKPRTYCAAAYAVADCGRVF